MKKQIVLASILVCVAQLLIAQPAIDSKIIAQYPKEGKPLFEVKLKGVKYTDHPDFSIGDWKGQWVVIDFFTMGCSACFANMPKMEKLQYDYKNRIKILMIGDTLAKLQANYEIFRKRLGLTLPVYFDQKRELFRRFGIHGVPHIVVVSPEGIVRGITTSVSKELFEKLVTNKDPEIQRYYYEPERDSLNALYDSRKPLLMNGNGGSDSVFLYRSVLANWTEGHFDLDSDIVVSGSTQVGLGTVKGRVQVIGCSISDLYLMAFGDTLIPRKTGGLNSYSRSWRIPIYETKDSIKIGSNWNLPIKYYSYSLIVPGEKATASFLQQAMQHELAFYFGYDVSVETRMMPCWKMQVVEGYCEKLKTSYKTKPVGNWRARQGFYFNNHDVNFLIKNIAGLFQEGYPIFDETGVTGNICMVVRALETDFEDVRRSLRENGIILVAGKAPMKVVVIKDKKS